MKPKYNTMLDVAFSVDHDFENLEDLLDTPEGLKLILSALRRRLEMLETDHQEACGAFGICDTYEHDW